MVQVQVVAGALNEVVFRYTPRTKGVHNVRVHLVDDKSRLVAAWAVVATVQVIE